MGTKILAYQTDDGKIFLGKTAQQEMERYERLASILPKVHKAMECARKEFDIPGATGSAEESLLDADISIKEQNFLRDTASHMDCSFRDIIECMVKMRAYDDTAFYYLCTFIREL